MAGFYGFLTGIEIANCNKKSITLKYVVNKLNGCMYSGSQMENTDFLQTQCCFCDPDRESIHAT